MQQLIAFVLIRHDTGGTGVFLRRVATHAQRLLAAGQRDDGHHRDRCGGRGDPRRGRCGVYATAVSMFALVQNLMGLAVGPVVTVPDTPARCGGSRPTPPRGAGGAHRGERLVRTHGLQGAHLRRGLEGRLGAAEPHASRRPDLVEGDFRVRTANRLWAADLTQIMTVRACCGWPASGCADPRAGAPRQRRQRRQRGLASMPVARVWPFSPNTSSDSAS